jgi:hypothetical protein
MTTIKKEERVVYLYSDGSRDYSYRVGLEIQGPFNGLKVEESLITTAAVPLPKEVATRMSRVYSSTIGALPTLFDWAFTCSGVIDVKTVQKCRMIPTDFTSAQIWIESDMFSLEADLFVWSSDGEIALVASMTLFNQGTLFFDSWSGHEENFGRKKEPVTTLLTPENYHVLNEKPTRTVIQLISRERNCYYFPLKSLSYNTQYEDILRPYLLKPLINIVHEYVQITLSIAILPRVILSERDPEPPTFIQIPYTSIE